MRKDTERKEEQYIRAARKGIFSSLFSHLETEKRVCIPYRMMMEKKKKRRRIAISCFF
jgi:hypothetical protein